MDELKTIEEVFVEDLKDPEFLKALRRTKPHNDLVSQVINRRSELGWTQRELAKRAGTYQSRISKIETGEHDFRLSTIVKIAEALNTEVLIHLIPLEAIPKTSETSFEDEDWRKLFGLHDISPIGANDAVGDLEIAQYEPIYDDSFGISNLTEETVQV